MSIYPISQPVLALIGPTAIGKTALSIQLAKEFGFEIISVDSMQVYKYMDIGTAKITSAEMDGVRHHLIDIVKPDEHYDASRFENDAVTIIENIHARGKRVLLTGGTGLYLRSLVVGLSEQLPMFPAIRLELQEELERGGREKLHELLLSIDCISGKRIHINDTQRLLRAHEIYRGTGKKWSDLIAEHQKTRAERFANLYIAGLTTERELLYKRIRQRSESMIDNGFEAEVEGLVERGYGAEHKSMRSIGYSHMLHFLQGKWDRKTMMENLTRDTRRYAKRQYTWFRKIDGIHWFSRENLINVRLAVASFIDNYLELHPSN